jgi:hypothetical protein
MMEDDNTDLHRKLGIRPAGRYSVACLKCGNDWFNFFEPGDPSFVASARCQRGCNRKLIAAMNSPGSFARPSEPDAGTKRRPGQSGNPGR